MSTLQENIQRLNIQQREAVLTTNGPVLIAAGAGSGKTRVLTHRIAYLVQEIGVNPWNILAITFTNKAATEMRERVANLVGEQAQQIWVMTFHAMCARILRREAEFVGYERNFSIIDTGEQQTLMKQVLKEENLDSERFNYKAMLQMIDDAKNQGYLPTDMEQMANSFIEKVNAQVYKSYQAKLKRANAMDFNDLILLTVKLLEENEQTRQFYQHKFQYIHVDEYQDTNHSQYRLVQLLAGLLRNVCVVGDADQSIYGWRGANMENILNFEKDYPDAKVILLEQNYRSTQNILKAANSVIVNNKKRKDKQLWSDNEVGEKVGFYHADTDRDEAQFVIQKIDELKKDSSYKNSDFAILYRTQAQSRSLEEQFLKANLPYKIVGGLKFYSRKEIQDTLAYLRLIDNPNDNISFNRIINVPKRGIGSTTVEKLAEFAEKSQLSWFNGIQHLTYSTLSKSTVKKLTDFAQMIQNLRKMSEFLSITELVEQVWEQTGYLESLKKANDLESANRIENLEEFASVTKQFDENGFQNVEENDPDFEAPNEASQPVQETSLFTLVDDTIEKESTVLTEFLTGISLVSDTTDEESVENQVTLMTMHAAKGLEFPYVFIVGMEDGLFPLSRALDSEEELEEERRLAYVGMTRAEKVLFLSATRSRLLYGRFQNNLPSRFIQEIDADLLEYLSEQPAVMQRTAIRSNYTQMPVKSAIHQVNQQATRSANKVALSKTRPISAAQNNTQSPNEWRAGDKVMHKVWGQGTIVQVANVKADVTLSIAFPNQGIKQLIAAYAPIEKVEE